MSIVVNFIVSIFLRLRMVIDGIVALFQVGAAMLSAKGDGLKAKAQVLDRNADFLADTRRLAQVRMRCLLRMFSRRVGSTLSTR